MYDVVIIGGGPGGYVAAIRAAQLGGRVALVEERELGGTCLNRGCIPTKALLESARRYREIRESASFGIRTGDVTLDLPAVVARGRQVVATLRTGVASLLAAGGVSLEAGRGAIEGAGRVRVTRADGSQSLLECRKIIWATGSQPAALPLPGADLPGVLTSESALALEALPDSIIIIGGGVIGMEFASCLSSFGVSVTVLEALESILPGQDAAVIAEATRLFRRAEIAIETGVKVLAIRPAPAAAPGSTGAGLLVEAAMPDGTHRGFTTDKVLIATGRRPNLGGMEPAALGIAMNGRAVQVDGFMRTSVPGLYAIGDLTGSALAHVASAQGIIAAEDALGCPTRPYDPRVVPGVIFTEPEIAAVGLTEAAARAAGHRVKVARFPFSALGKALAAGHASGFIQVVAEEEYGEILGVHIIGPHAGDLIHEAVGALSLECTVEELARMIHAHPTLSEGILEAAHGLHGGFIHLPAKGRQRP